MEFIRNNYDGDPGYKLRFGVTTTAVLSIAYGLVFVLGLIGNAFVVGVVCRSRAMRSPTNLFIANLACADLLVVALCLPFTLVGNLIPAWILGDAICKAVSYLQGVSVSASINTLMAISIERCAAIATSWGMRRAPVTVGQCYLVVLGIWSVALTVNIPWIVVFTLEPIGINGSVALTCAEIWPNQFSENLYFVLANLCICYLIPLSVISVCYLLIWRRLAARKFPGEASGGQKIVNRSKIKAIKMILIVIITFALSWLPLYTLFTIIKFNLITVTETSITATLIPISQWLGASNSCINPFYYAYFNQKFRMGFKAILTSRSCCEPLRFDGCASCYNRSYNYKLNHACSLPIARKQKDLYINRNQDSSSSTVEITLKQINWHSSNTETNTNNTNINTKSTTQTGTYV